MSIKIVNLPIFCYSLQIVRIHYVIPYDSIPRLSFLQLGIMHKLINRLNFWQCPNYYSDRGSKRQIECHNHFCSSVLLVQAKCMCSPLGLQAEDSGCYELHFFSLLSSFSCYYFTPGRGCPRVLKYCMRSWVTKGIRLHLHYKWVAAHLCGNLL